jgi:5-formyltetrahydrofolate cyclo-ligase
LTKSLLRLALKKMRAALPSSRRQEASHSLCTHLLPSLSQCRWVLSFASFDDEIDTTPLNLLLAHTGRLLLPKLCGDRLHIFQVTDLGTQLIRHSLGFYEPDPKRCVERENTYFETILVPALGFDADQHRLGYGKGCYDRFLKEVPHASTIGIGFKEQFIDHLPTDPTDIPLKKVSLF